MPSIDQKVLMGAGQTGASWVGPDVRLIYDYQDMTWGLAKAVLIRQVCLRSLTINSVCVVVRM